jgi:hypothetical protein
MLNQDICPDPDVRGASQLLLKIRIYFTLCGVFLSCVETLEALVLDMKPKLFLKSSRKSGSKIRNIDRYRRAASLDESTVDSQNTILSSAVECFVCARGGKVTPCAQIID